MCLRFIKGKAKKSVAFALTYRHDERTLNEEDIAKTQNEILKALEEKLGLTLRDN